MPTVLDRNGADGGDLHPALFGVRSRISSRQGSLLNPNRFGYSASLSNRMTLRRLPIPPHLHVLTGTSGYGRGPGTRTLKPFGSAF